MPASNTTVQFLPYWHEAQSGTIERDGRLKIEYGMQRFTGDPQSPQRGLPSTPQQPRFIGLQTHTGQVLFRRIQWKAL